LTLNYIAGDDVVQEAIWNLHQGEIKTKVDAKTGETSLEETKNEAQQLASSFHSLINAFIGHISFEGQSILTDLASFFRLFLADTAEMVEERARGAKESLRQVEDEVQKGDRDPLGRQKVDEQFGAEDPQARFERGMDTAKDIGSKVIGVTESTAEATREHTERARENLSHSMDAVSHETQYVFIGFSDMSIT
jgi:hypothetical protein